MLIKFNIKLKNTVNFSKIGLLFNLFSQTYEITNINIGTPSFLYKRASLAAVLVPL